MCHSVIRGSFHWGIYSFGFAQLTLLRKGSFHPLPTSAAGDIIIKALKVPHVEGHIRQLSGQENVQGSLPQAFPVQQDRAEHNRESFRTLLRQIALMMVTHKITCCSVTVSFQIDWSDGTMHLSL